MDTEEVINIPRAKLHVSKLNTRQPKPRDPAVKSLAKSLAEFGQTTPLIVRPHPDKKGKFEIGAGARRSVAAGVAKLDSLKTSTPFWKSWTSQPDFATYAKPYADMAMRRARERHPPPARRIRPSVPGHAQLAQPDVDVLELRGRRARLQAQGAQVQVQAPRAPGPLAARRAFLPRPAFLRRLRQLN